MTSAPVDQWTEHDFWSTIIAALAVLVSVGSLLVAIFGPRRYHARPHFRFYVRPGSDKSGFPFLFVRFIQLGPADAYDVQVCIKKPHDVWRQRGVTFHMPPREAREFYRGVTTTTDTDYWPGTNDGTSDELDPKQRAQALKPPASWNPQAWGSPILGRWGFRLVWNGSPDPNKKVQVTLHHRVTRRHFEKGIYAAELPRAVG